jgi:hypothetical protein
MEEEKHNLLSETYRDYVWSYFVLHAQQRLQTFQFFITLATAILGGILLLNRSVQSTRLIFILGFLLMFFSFIFWKLDRRNRNFVRNAEAALKYFESQNNLRDEKGAPNPLNVFLRADFLDSQESPYFTYRRCFKYVFAGFALIGLGIVIASITCLL